MAVSATVRASGPMYHWVTKALSPGTRGMRPNDGLWPTMPQQLAGMRTEPAMSVPRAR